MTVHGIARSAGVLARDAAGLRSLLQEAGLVHDQDTARRIAEMVNDVVAQIVSHRVSIPRSGIQEALDAFCAALADRLRQLPAVLALDAIEQASEIAPGALAHRGTREAMGNAPVQRIQHLRPPRGNARSITHALRDHWFLLRYGRAGYSESLRSVPVGLLVVEKG